MNDSTTLFVRPPVWVLLAAVAVGGCFFLGGKYIETRNANLVTINVSGEGKVSAAPDIAQLDFGMQTGRQKTSQLAMQKLKTAMDSVLAAVKAQGIEDKDISTEQFALNPSYDWSNGQQTLLGYEANQLLHVKVHDLQKVSTVLAAATSAGANQAGGVNFTIDDPETLRAQARSKAIVQAQQKAQELAKELGMRLGSIKGFSEGGGSMPPVPLYAKSAMGMGGAGDIQAQTIPLPAGEQEVDVQVTLTYELR